jgi:repressor LexA
MQGLTDRQRAVLQVIVSNINHRGYPPTLREIGEELSIRSTNGVNDHLKALERKGFLTRDDQKSRALVPTERALRSLLGADFNVVSFPGAERAGETGDMVRVDIYHGVAAGALEIEAQDTPDDSVYVDRFFLGTNDAVFGLRISGDSMIEDGILDGDYVFVRKQSTAPNGSLVVCFVNQHAGEATVKRFYREGDRIRLQPSNKEFAPIYIHKKDFLETQIMGVVVGVYRKLR